MNAFLAAQQDGRIPAFATGGGPDYETGVAVIHIPEESDDYRRAIAAGAIEPPEPGFRHTVSR